MLSFEDYDEATIVSHINFCEQVKQLFLTSYISVSSQSIVATFDAAQHPETSTSSESGDRIPMPAAILDAVNSACEVSGKYAALRAVQNMRLLVYTSLSVLLLLFTRFYSLYFIPITYRYTEAVLRTYSLREYCKSGCRAGSAEDSARL